MRIRAWLPFTGLILTLHAAAWVVAAWFPASWRDFHADTFLKLLATLGTVQLASSALTTLLRHRFGLVLGGIAAGITSSTLSTLLQARRSRQLAPEADRHEAVLFLAAYLGMLTQCAFIIYGGVATPTTQLLGMFGASALVVVIMIGVRHWRTAGEAYQAVSHPPHILDLIKLAAFMLVLILLTHALQSSFGSGALLGITAVASFFEMHGSLMTNIQLRALGRVDDRFLATLFLVSLMASNLSKAGIVVFQGTHYLRRKVVLWLAIISATQVLTWVLLAPEF